MTCKELIGLLIDKMASEGDDVDVLIYDRFYGKCMEITSIGSGLFTNFIIEIGEYVDL